MPGMDGFETAEQMRTDLLLTVPVVVLRSVGRPGNATYRDSFGIHAYLNKPGPAGSCCAPFALPSERGCHLRLSLLPAPLSPSTGLRCVFLLAEDNPVNRMLAVRLLEREGHRVTAACTTAARRLPRGRTIPSTWF